jgi:hypothetical protein
VIVLEFSAEVSAVDREPANRRQFGKQVAALAATPLAIDVLAEPAQAQPDPTVVAAEALFAITQARYAKFLTPAQLIEVKASIVRNLKTAELLRQVKLENGDAPVIVFHAELP